MSLTDRDRKIVVFLVPLVLLLAYWFLVLSPKREEATQAGEQLTLQQDTLAATRVQLDQMRGAKTSFAADYTEMVKLGKAIPSAVDMPSLIVQLDEAARGTRIDFAKIAVGEREVAEVAVGQPPAAAGGDPAAPASAGGAPAQSAQGATAEGAADATNSANAANADSGVSPADAQTSETVREGGLPVGGGAAGAATGAATCGAAGLECVSLELEFTGGFFDLADFFHRLKRFVKVDGERMLVRGRLMTVDGLTFSGEDGSKSLRATITATVYLSPRAQGATAGATPQGPAITPVSSDVGADPDGSVMPPTATTTP